VLGAGVGAESLATDGTLATGGVGAEVGDWDGAVLGDWAGARSATGTGQCTVTGLEPRSATGRGSAR
jgi:hypothetical protein